MRVFVAGATGAIGSPLVSALVRQGRHRFAWHMMLREKQAQL